MEAIEALMASVMGVPIYGSTASTINRQAPAHPPHPQQPAPHPYEPKQRPPEYYAKNDRSVSR